MILSVSRLDVKKCRLRVKNSRLAMKNSRLRVKKCRLDVKPSFLTSHLKKVVQRVSLGCY